MTVIYTLEMTVEFDEKDKSIDQAEQAVLDPERKAVWMHKIERVMEQHIPDANITCNNIQVFPTV